MLEDVWRSLQEECGNADLEVVRVAAPRAHPPHAEVPQSPTATTTGPSPSWQAHAATRVCSARQATAAARATTAVVDVFASAPDAEAFGAHVDALLSELAQDCLKALNSGAPSTSLVGRLKRLVRALSDVSARHPLPPPTAAAAARRCGRIVLRAARNTRTRSGRACCCSGGADALGCPWLCRPAGGGVRRPRVRRAAPHPQAAGFDHCGRGRERRRGPS